MLNGTSKKYKTKILMTNGSLMKVKSIAECSKGSILQYFLPALRDNWSRKPIFGLFESGSLTQVLLYMIFSILVIHCSSEATEDNMYHVSVPLEVGTTLLLACLSTHASSHMKVYNGYPYIDSFFTKFALIQKYTEESLKQLLERLGSLDDQN